MLDPEAAPEPARAEPLLPSTRKGRWIVVAILVLAFALRAGYVVSSRDWYSPRTDSEHFDKIAVSIANGEGYGPAILPPSKGDSALRAPLYPASLAVVYFVVGDHKWTAGRLVNALFGTAIVALIGLIGAQLWSRRVATIAMALAAVYPTLILVGSGLQLEPLLVMLSLGAVAAALQHRRAPRGLLWPLVAGVLLGLAVLTRELGFLLVPSLIWLLWTNKPRFSRAALMAPGVFAIAAFLVVAPWVVRNILTFEEPVLISTGAGYGLAGTFNETAMEDGRHPAQWIQPVEDPQMLEVLLARRNPTELEVDSDLRDEVVEVIKDHPVYPLKAVVWGTQRLFDWDGGEYSRTIIAEYVPYSKSLTRLSVYTSYVVFALALVGAFLKPARRVPFAIWLIPILLYAFIVITLPASIRYRASIEPYLVLLASLAIAAGIDRFQQRRREGAPEPEPVPAAVNP